MRIFNLKDHLSAFVERFMIKHAMGSTHQKNREQYEWWDYQGLSNNNAPNIEEWNDSVQAEPSLVGIINEAETLRRKRISDCKRDYGIPLDVGEKMMKTYIGYSPAYGGYICQIGPYVSKHQIQQAVGKFSFYVLRRRKASAEGVNEALAKKIKKFTATYGNLVDLDPSDFSYDVKMQSQHNLDAVNQAHPTIKHIDSLDYTKPEVKEFFNNAPVEGVGSNIELNAKGYIKIMKAYLGPQYVQVMTEQMTAENKTEEQVVNEMFAQPSMLRKIYGRALEMWNEAVKRGDPVALAAGRPPSWKDKQLSTTSGAQVPTGPGKPSEKPILDAQGNVIGTKKIPASRTKQLIDVYSLEKEMLSIISEIRKDPNPSVDQSQLISDKLNANKDRIKTNKKAIKDKAKLTEIVADLNKRQAAGEDVSEEILRINDKISKLNPVYWTKEDVDSYLSEMEEEKLNNPEQSAAEVTEVLTNLDDSSGYDDLKTAFKMAKMYFSAHSVDGASGAKIGVSNSIIFNPPEDFYNYTKEDLQPYVKFDKAAEDTPVATPEDIQQELGDIETDPTRTEQTQEPIPAETTEVPAAGTPSEIPTEESLLTPQPEVPVAQTPPEKSKEEIEKEKKRQELDALFGHTLKNLIKIAEDLDNDGKFVQAEEVHKVIRKYEEKF